MGGGDLNSKKSWHPNTMKNQERVWKAEQIAAEEKKRILELQQERAQERDRHELNELARKTATSTNTSDNRLDWMYNKPDKQVQEEDYLLGKAIDKNFDQPDKAEQNEIPAVARRVVGSSMLSSASDVQVDLARKIREDPLLLVRERERAARAALLNNPVQRKRLAELLRKEQEQKKVQKKKSKKANKDLDNMLAAKLNALSSNKVDLAKLLESDDSSEDSSDEEKPKKKKKKKKSKKHKTKDKRRDNCDEGSDSKKHKKHRHSEEDDRDSSKDSKSRKYSSKRKSSYSEDETVSLKKKYKKHDKGSKHDDSSQNSYNSNIKQSHYSKHTKYDQDQYEYDRKEHKKHSKEREKTIDDARKEDKTEWSRAKNSKYERSEDRSERTSYRTNIKEDRKVINRKGLSEEEKAAKLAEMAAAGVEREIQRGRRVAAQLAENSAAEKCVMSRVPSRNEARALPESLESRIHSNRHYIQRDQRHMNENFARR